ncbi:GEVED domain-containing protein [Flavivirga spongiicola]|uniref:GEVED domain-containing protein n=1 Tax=Flavivirga spongiicola TaxID=421621 RepID=A0ABU7XYS3_9FLAO|nr:GEVED domain-containing protein [Flavivirga sp. MEBiC05379]MDO5980951.1 GEVED domain-containing protein [Flavivirga sp. MEBiC05379]
MKKNKLNFLMSLLALSMILFSSCEEDDLTTVSLNEIELSESALQLSINEVKPIIVTPSPDTTTEKVTWSSSDEQVAEIQFSENGLVAGVKGISLGEAILTAKNVDGNITKTVTINVIIKVESIALEEVVSANPSQTSYNVIFTPENASIKEVTWSSSDPSVISVDANGNVTAISPGVAVITAMTIQGEKTAVIQLATSGDPVILGLQYCSISGTGGYNADTIVTTGAEGNINYSGSQPTNNYELSTETLVVTTDSQFSISLTQSNNWSKSKIWIDWNGDKDFEDAGELVIEFGLDAQLNDGPFNDMINVPVDAAVGTSRMRVQTLDAWTNYGLCGDVANQTTKDFEVEILGVSYCSISGTGGYNADTVTTTGGDTNLNYSGAQPAGNYEFYTTETLSTSIGNSFTLDLVQSNNWSKSKVWIDWNADGDFEDVGELVIEFGLDAQLNDGPFSESLTVPNNAATGNTRMRIQTLDAWVDFGLCGDVANQTTKDFKVSIF